MGSFKLSTSDGKEVTGSGCMLALLSGAVEFVGIIAGACLLTTQGVGQLPRWMSLLEGADLIANVAKWITILVLIAPGLLVFLLGSRWLKRRGIAVWQNPGNGA